MTRTRFAVWLTLLILLAGAIGYRLNEQRQPPAPPPARIAFVTGGSGPYWQLTANGARAAAQRFHVDLQIKMPTDNESLQQQTTILDELDLGRLDGVAVSPLDADGQTSLIDRLAKKTKVVTFDSDAVQSDRLSHIGTSNLSAGATCARMMNELLPNGGKLAVLLANLTKQNVIERKAGFEEQIAKIVDSAPAGSAAPKYDVVGYLVDNGNADTCATNIREAIEKHPDLACFVGMNSAHGPVLIETLKELNKLGQIKLITFDVQEETLAGVEAGHIHATLAQDPFKFGYHAVETLNMLAHGDETMVPIVGRGAILITAEPITRENLAELRERMNKQMAAPTQTDTTNRGNVVK